MDSALNRITEVWFREHAEHVVGTELSLADIVLAVMLTHIVNMAQFDLSAHPKLQKFVDGLKVSVKGL
jgi:glutathione S-transferase